MRRLLAVLLFSFAAAPALAVCKSVSHNTSTGRFVQGGMQHFICDADADLTTLVGFNAGDTAFSRSSSKLWKRSTSAWVEIPIGGAPSADDTVAVSDSASSVTWRALPNCNTVTEKLIYATATNTWSCQTDAGGSGAANFLEVEIDFGAGGNTTFNGTAIAAWATATSVITCAPTALATADRAEAAEDAIIEGLTVAIHTRSGGGFSIMASPALGKAYGRFKIHCVGSS